MTRVNGYSWLLKTGETNVERAFTLQIDGGPIDLSEFDEVRITMRQGSKPPVVDDALCEILDQQATPGKGKFVFVTVPPAGTYAVEWKLVNGSQTIFVPQSGSPARKYGTLIVSKSLV